MGLKQGTTWVLSQKKGGYNTGSGWREKRKNNTTVAYRGGDIMKNMSNITHNKIIRKP